MQQQQRGGGGHREGFLQCSEDMTRWTAITKFQGEATYLSESVTSNCGGKHLQTGYHCRRG